MRKCKAVRQPLYDDILNDIHLNKEYYYDTIRDQYVIFDAVFSNSTKYIISKSKFKKYFSPVKELK
jgi:hypothetical protein